MEIIIKGTEKEIERARNTIEGTCYFNSEFCDSGIPCEKCERNQGLEITYRAKG